MMSSSGATEMPSSGADVMPSSGGAVMPVRPSRNAIHEPFDAWIDELVEFQETVFHMINSEVTVAYMHCID